MYSRFKFLSCVDPKQKSENTPTKARFSKLTLRKVNTVDDTKRIIPPAQETLKPNCEIKNIGNKNTTNMDENVVIHSRKESEDSNPSTENKNTGQKPKLLLYESTIESTSKHSEQNSSLLTDDDTDSVGSSVDTNFFNNALANEKVSQPVQKVNEIESQLESLSISTPIAKTSRDNRVNEMLNLSQKFNELDLIKETDEFKAFEQKVEQRSFLECSAITLSSSASTPAQTSNATCDTSKHIDEVIVLSDTSDDEPQDTAQPAKQRPGEGYFYNVTPAAANCERLDSLVMQRINNFFDNVPELNPEEAINATVLSTDLSKPDSVYISETSVEEDNQHVSLVKSSIDENEINRGKRDIKSREDSTHFDTPDNTNCASEKQSIAQPKKKCETETKSTPLKTASNVISNKQSSGSTPSAVKSSGSSVQVTSMNSGHINISAVININIKISERSSSADSVIKVNPNSAPIETPELETNPNNETPPPNQNTSIVDDTLSSKSAKSSTNTDVADSDVSVDKTPSQHSQSSNQVEQATNLKSSKDEKVEIDENLSVDAKQQQLLNSLYGPSWKTPEVLRSFRKDKQNDLNDKHFNPPVSRMSKGFNLFKRNIAIDLDSTRIDEISIIENTEISVIQNVEINKNLHSPKETNTSDNTKNSPMTRQRNTRKAALKVREMLQKDDELTDDEMSSENGGEDSDWRCDGSDSESDNAINTLTRSKQRGTKKPPSTSSKPAKKNPVGSSNGKRNKNKDDKLVYLDLSANEIVEVDENFTHNASEDDLAEVTKRFLEDDLVDDNKDNKAEEKENFKKPKPRRKLFTHQYGSLDDDSINQTKVQRTPATKIRGTNESDSNVKIDIPQFIFKPRKLIGTTSSTTTPLSKDLPKPMLDAVTKSLNVKPKGGHNRILSNAENNVRSSKMNRPDIFVTPTRTHGFLKSLDVCVSLNLCHPDALIYRNNFKSNKEELTKLLYELYNDKVFENKLDVSITWNKKLISTAGRCVCNQKSSSGRYARIELSEKVVTSADRLRCTLVHELCHAATWVFSGGKGHGAIWKNWASRAQKVFPELPEIKVCHDYDIEYKYTYKCDICQSKSHSHSKSKKVENIRCSYCHGSISIFINKKQKDGKIVQTPVREASGFAKFVKEKYREFKVPGKTHAEIMRLISDNFSALSVEEKKKY